MRHRLTWVVLPALFAAAPAGAQPPNGEPAPAAQSEVSRPRETDRSYPGEAAELQPGTWTGGGGLGILGSTPDGSAFAMNGNLEYLLNERVSVGPLLQMGFTDDLTQVGLSAQGKYYLDVPGTSNRGKLALQSGLGFVHADFLRDDTSWLVPMGVGYEYTLDAGTTLTANALVNFTNLRTGFGTDADVMPGLTFGVRF